MYERNFEKFNKPESSPRIKKPEIKSVEEQKLAESLEKDSRFIKIQEELIANWEKTNGDRYDEQGLLKGEFQDLLFGNPTDWYRGGKPTTIEEKAQKIFAERFPEDAKKYAEIERKKTYENPADDPAIRETEESIIKLTNKKLMEWGKRGLKGVGWDWRSAYIDVSMSEWSRFLDKYPEKAEAYRDKFENIKRAFERKKEKEEIEKKKREEASFSIPDELFRKGKVGNEQEVISQQDTREFTPKNPDIIKQHDADIPQFERPQNKIEESPETSQSIKIEKQYETEVKPNNIELSLTKRIDDLEQLEKLRDSLKLNAEEGLDQEQIKSIFSFLSSLKESHRFKIYGETLEKQQTLEIKLFPKLLPEFIIVIKTDNNGNFSRWEIKKDGKIRSREFNYNLLNPNSIINNIKTISGRESLNALKILFKKFAKQIKAKLEVTKQNK
jgi:hypothetical protein